MAAESHNMSPLAGKRCDARRGLDAIRAIAQMTTDPLVRGGGRRAGRRTLVSGGGSRCGGGGRRCGGGGRRCGGGGPRCADADPRCGAWQQVRAGGNAMRLPDGLGSWPAAGIGSRRWGLVARRERTVAGRGTAVGRRGGQDERQNRPLRGVRAFGPGPLGCACIGTPCGWDKHPEAGRRRATGIAAQRDV